MLDEPLQFYHLGISQPVFLGKLLNNIIWIVTFVDRDVVNFAVRDQDLHPEDQWWHISAQHRAMIHTLIIGRLLMQTILQHDVSGHPITPSRVGSLLAPLALHASCWTLTSLDVELDLAHSILFGYVLRLENTLALLLFVLHLVVRSISPNFRLVEVVIDILLPLGLVAAEATALLAGLAPVAS